MAPAVSVHPPQCSPRTYAKLNFSHGTRPTEQLRRARAALHSFRVLKNLSPKQVQSFMDSYIIYELDWADEESMIGTLGVNYQQRVGACLSDYYSVLNHLCSLGALEKMYIPPFLGSGMSIWKSQTLYERSIATELQLPPKAHILDLGCGRGRVAAHMSHMAGCRVTGINIDADQIANARTFNAKSSQTAANIFIQHDFNTLPLPLPSSTYDGFYQIQAFSLSRDVRALARELYRVLKPGARLSLLDWARLKGYDPNDSHHAELMRQIKPLIGAVGTPTPESLADDLRSAGFIILESGNASSQHQENGEINRKRTGGEKVSGPRLEKDEYGPQEPLIKNVDGYFRALRKCVLCLVKARIFPGHFETLFDRLTKDCEAFVEADRKGLVTTSWHWLAVKPNGEDVEKNMSEDEDSGVSSAEEKA